MLRADILFKLDEKTLPAHERMQREVRLHGIELVGSKKALTQGRHAKINERVHETSVAEAASALNRTAGSCNDIAHGRDIHR